MFAVIFEVTPRPEQWDAYLAHAAALRPELLAIDGFLDNRRYASRRHPGQLLSLSLWRDEKSVIRWRTHGGHHAVQVAGRQAVFSDYHLRVGEVARDNGQVLPPVRLDETESGAARAVTLIETPTDDAPPAGIIDWDRFDGITVPGSTLLLLSWPDMAAMGGWTTRGGGRRLDIRVIRDYGLRDRAEAPQYHRPVSD
ncbi:MAG: antibiotic biosynthesis monooxygenase [Acetobacteraceae bacterium]